jgi:ATP-dependent DNA ligase
MIAYPPKPTSILPHESRICEYLIQPKWRGWRIAIHKNKSWTRKGVSIPVLHDYPEKCYDYQLDGEIISLDKEVEHQVRKAIKENKYAIRIFDIWIPSRPDMMIEDRLKLLKDDFDISVETYKVNTAKEVESLFKKFTSRGNEGLVMKKLGSPYLAGNGPTNLIDRNWSKIR